MTNDDAETVFVADVLRRRFPALFAELEGLTAFDVRLREVAGTRDVWCRDFMPVPIRSGRFAKFVYSPDYLVGWESTITPDTATTTLDVITSCRFSQLIIDGGNVVRCGETAVVTDKVYEANPWVTAPDLRHRLQDELEVERLVIIPSEPGDLFCHSDGVVHLLDGHTALVNDYSVVDPNYGRALRGVLAASGIEAISVPFAPQATRSGAIPVALGLYVNFLRLRDLVLVPTYHISIDAAAVRLIESLFPRQRVVCFDCRAIAMEGGALHCVTWTPTPPSPCEARQCSRQEL